MANKHPNTSGLRPPWQPGQSGNPKGRKKSKVNATLKTLFGKSAKKIYELSQTELDEWDSTLISLTKDQLSALVMLDSAPAYPKAQALAILTDMKNGRTVTIERLANRLYDRKKPDKVELTGKDGSDLLQPRVLTKEEAAAFLDKLNADY